MTNDVPHRRKNPLTGEWVLVSPQRAKRPWQGLTDPIESPRIPSYDPSCYLCPGNPRAGGIVNPDYNVPFAFTNDFPALLPESTPYSNQDPLFTFHNERGLCRVLCYSPRHDLTLSLMPDCDIVSVLNLWIEEYSMLSAYNWVKYIQLFENRGSQMGCSNPHPHCQIWASESIPVIPALELENQRKYSHNYNRCLLCEYLQKEKASRERLVYVNASFAALIPFWAVWPYELMILPQNHHIELKTLSDKEKADLADILGVVNRLYDNLFRTSFPFSMGLHQAPIGEEDIEACHFHFHFYPPLLRSANIRKFMVGYELLSSPQRDITAEQAAETLRNLPLEHFSRKLGEKQC